MIDVPKSIFNRIKAGESIECLESYLMNNYPMPVIISSLAKLLVNQDNTVNKPQIIITAEEFEQIQSLFKIRGQRVVDGEVIQERRGRPRLNKEL